MDEGYTVNAVDSGMRNGTKRFAAILNSGKTYFCPVYCIPTESIVRFFGSQPFAYRLFSAVLGAVFIILVYFFTRSIFQDKRIALLAAFFTSFSYWQIAWSRQARWYTLLEVVFWLSLWLFFCFLKSTERKKKILYLASSIFCVLIAIATHRLASLLPIIMLAWYAIDTKPSVQRYILASCVMIGGLCIIELIPELRFITGAIKNIQLHSNISHYGLFYLKTYLPFLPFIAIGFRTVQTEGRKLMTLVALPFILYLIPLSFLTDTIEYRYLFHTTAAFYILASVGVIRIWDRLNATRSKIIYAISMATLFFLSGHGVLIPTTTYALESDNPSDKNNSYYAYTPQPDFNGAYAAIKEQIKPTEIVISSHPHFTQIFLNQPGYWIAYDYLGRTSPPDTYAQASTEPYVGAAVIHSLAELKDLTRQHHGYILFDFMATDNRIDRTILEYIRTNMAGIYFNKTSDFSMIWVYRF
ncbi:glycosyltransferase family 39 protein [Patescibacteria group bacterium]|nr:glycosyltransferase family 39 protein [Patescibacteria group bacterium]